MNRTVVAAPILIACFLTACSTSSGGDHQSEGKPSSNAPTPSISVKVSPAPDGHGAVGIDPCTAVGDSVITELGFDPATRARADQVHETYSFIGCNFDHKVQTSDGINATDRSLTVWVTSLSVDDFRKRPDNGKIFTNLSDVTIDGHSGFEYQNQAAESCFIAAPLSRGTLNISQVSNSDYSSGKPCDQIEHEASVLINALSGH